MNSDSIVASFLSRYTEGVQALMQLEERVQREEKVKDVRLSYEPVRDLTVEQILAKTDVRAEPKLRANSSLYELVGSMTSLLCSRHYLAGAMGTPTPASREAVQQLATGIERMLATVPASAQWVPVAAFMALVVELRKPI